MNGRTSLPSTILSETIRHSICHDVLGLMQAGAQGAAVLGVQVNGDGTMSTPVHMNFGDFASSAGLEQLLDQLAQQHQPASDPATRAVVEALPKRLVPPLDKDAPDGDDPRL